MELEILVQTANLDQSNWRERRKAVRRLTDTKDLQAIPFILEVLQDRAKDVKLQGIYAIQSFIEDMIIPDEVIPALITCLHNHSDIEEFEGHILVCFEKILVATGLKHAAKLKHEIARLASKSSHHAIRSYAADCMDAFSLEAIPSLCVCLDDDSSLVVMSALKSLDNIMRSMHYIIEQIPFNHRISIANSLSDIISDPSRTDEVVTKAKSLDEVIQISQLIFDDPEC